MTYATFPRISPLRPWHKHTILHIISNTDILHLERYTGYWTSDTDTTCWLPQAILPFRYRHDKFMSTSHSRILIQTRHIHYLLPYTRTVADTTCSIPPPILQTQLLQFHQPNCKHDLFNSTSYTTYTCSIPPDILQTLVQFYQSYYRHDLFNSTIHTKDTTYSFLPVILQTRIVQFHQPHCRHDLFTSPIHTRILLQSTLQNGTC